MISNVHRGSLLGKLLLLIDVRVRRNKRICRFFSCFGNNFQFLVFR